MNGHSRINMKSLRTQIKVSTLSLGLVVGFSFIQAEEPAPTLNEQLMERASQSKMPAPAKAKMAQHLKELTESDLVAGALKVGDTAPNFTLKDHLGKERSLSEYLNQGPVVMTWYRGGW